MLLWDEVQKKKASESYGHESTTTRSYYKISSLVRNNTLRSAIWRIRHLLNPQMANQKHYRREKQIHIWDKCLFL